VHFLFAECCEQFGGWIPSGSVSDKKFYYSDNGFVKNVEDISYQSL